MAVLALLVFAAPVRGYAQNPIVNQDEGLLLVYPALILHGEVANRSFESVYGTGSLWPVATAFSVLGYSDTSERLVGLIYRATIVAAIGAMVWRRRGRWSALAASAISTVLLAETLGLVAFAWLASLAFGALALLLLDVAADRDRPRVPLVLSGTCLGFAFAARLDFALAIALAMAVLGFFRRGSLRWLVPGVVIGMTPLFVNVAHAGVLAVVRREVIQPIFVSGPARRLPLSALGVPLELLLAVCVVLTVMTVALAVRLLRSDRRNAAGITALTVGAFELGLLPEAFQRADSAHLAFVACFIVPASMFLTPWPATGPLRRRIVLVVTGCLVAGLAAPMFGRDYLSAVRRSVAPEHVQRVANAGRSVVVGWDDVMGRGEKTHLTALIAKTNAISRPGERLFVGPTDLRKANYGDTFVYFLFPQLHPGSFYLEMEPGIANGRNSRLANDIEQADVLILDSNLNLYGDPDPATNLGSNRPNQVVAQKFHLVGRWGEWNLYRRNGPPA